MEVNIEIVVALISGILAPLIIQLITNQLKKVEQRKRQELENAGNTPTIERDLRNELREESVRQRARAQALEEDIDELAHENDELREALSKWKTSFYQVKTEKSKIEWELAVLRQEIDSLKKQIIMLQQTKEKMNGTSNGN